MRTPSTNYTSRLQPVSELLEMIESKFDQVPVTNRKQVVKDKKIKKASNINEQISLIADKVDGERMRN